MGALHAPWMSALGWALLHSLWQGLGVALLAALGLRLLQRQSAQARYAFAYGALVLMAGLAAATFWMMLPQPGPDPARGLIREVGLQARLAAWMPYASLAWLGGVGIMATRLGLGWAWLLRLRSREAEPATAPWQARLDDLALRLGVQRGVRLLSSLRVTTPMVVGWIKPAVLIPASAFLGLSPEALEAVLAHELAHVRRLDFLFNLLQNLLETLLFYHPATWWLGSQIRQEREHAADDLAIALAGGPLRYARALADLEALRSLPSTSLQLAPAATGGHLMNRIRRILLPPAPLPTARAGLLTALAVAALGACTAVGFAEEAKPKEIRRMVLRQGDKHIDLKLKGDAQLDPRSGNGVTLGEDGSIELTVREAPVRKSVTIRKDAKGVAQVFTENGQEKPLQGAEEAWVKQILGDLKGMEGKVEPGKAKTIRLHLEETGKDGKSTVVIVSNDSDGLQKKVKEAKKVTKSFHIEADKEGKRHVIVGVAPKELGEGGEEVRIVAKVEEGKDGKPIVTIDGEPVKNGEITKDGKKIFVQTEVLNHDKPHKEVRIETKVDTGKDGVRKVVIREGDKVTEHAISGTGIWVSEGGIRKALGDPKAEAEGLRKQIEHLQKRLKDLEAKAKATPEKK